MCHEQLCNAWLIHILECPLSMSPRINQLIIKLFKSIIVIFSGFIVAFASFVCHKKKIYKHKSLVWMYNENTLRKLCLNINCMVQKVRMTDFVMINKFSGVNSNKMLLQNILIVLVLTACQGETLTWTNMVVYLLVFCYVFIIAILGFLFFFWLLMSLFVRIQYHILLKTITVGKWSLETNV